MAEAVLTGTVVVDSTAQEVWDYLTDWPRQGEWIPLTTVEPVGDPKARPGARIRAYTGVGSLRFADPMTVTDCEPPHRLAVEHTGRVVRGTGSWLVEDAGSGARLTWEERFTLPAGAVGALGWRLSRGLWQQVLDRSLRRLAENCRRRS